jgi:hypothetical protein
MDSRIYQLSSLKDIFPSHYWKLFYLKMYHGEKVYYTLIILLYKLFYPHTICDSDNIWIMKVLLI